MPRTGRSAAGRIAMAPSMMAATFLAAAVLLTAPLCGAQPVESLTARRGPDFLDRAILYQIWMRSFTPEGTLKASARRLPHIASLGASAYELRPGRPGLARVPRAVAARERRVPGQEAVTSTELAI